MIYSEFLNGTLSWNNIFPNILFYVLGAVVAALLTFAGHILACLMTKSDLKDFSIGFRKNGILNPFTIVGTLLVPLIGVGFTKPTAYDKERKFKSVFIALFGPVFTLIISYALLFVYYFNSNPTLGSLLIGLSSSGILMSLSNLLPLPGLCGGVFISAVLPEKLSEKWNNLKDIRIFILIIVIVIIIRTQTNVAVSQWIIRTVNVFFGE